MELTARENALIQWFHSLSRVEQLAVICWLHTGDTQLLLCLRESSDRLKCFNYATFSQSSEQPLLNRR
jgi:hypothetical protein